MIDNLRAFVAQVLRSLAKKIDRDYQIDRWEQHRRAIAFVEARSSLSLDALTDLAIRRGVYSSTNSRKTILGHLRSIREDLSSAQSKIENRNSKIPGGELLRS